MKGSAIEIDSKTAVDFLLPRHYSGRIPTISKAFGWYDGKTYTNEHLKAVCTFGKPASPPPMRWRLRKAIRKSCVRVEPPLPSRGLERATFAIRFCLLA